MADAKSPGRQYWGEALTESFGVPTSSLCLITGLPGAGKTTFAAKLASLTSAPTFSSEALWATAFGHRSGENDHDFAPEELRGVYDTLLYLARQCLAAQHGVIVEGIFRSAASRLPFEELARSSEVRFMGYYLTCDEAQTRRRLETRMHDRNSISPAGVRVYDAIRHSYERPRNYIHIDTSELDR